MTIDRLVTNEQQAREQSLEDRVVDSFDACGDPRLKEIVVSLTRALHGFVRDVRLTEAEWEQAIAFLTACGHITDDRRQEFILLSDVFGLSMQAITVNNPADGDVTESTVFGPFFLDGSPEVPIGGSIAGDAQGEPCWVEGVVTDTTGRPIAGAVIEVWEADEDGFYDVQYDDGRMAARAHLITDSTGSYAFWGITPTPYPIPHDGPVGALLQHVGRSPMRASHLHFMVTHPDHRTLVTHIFVRGDELLDSDSVFGVKDSLVKDFVTHAAGEPGPNGHLRDAQWSSVRFDIVLGTPAP